jgi:hypothetical protein
LNYRKPLVFNFFLFLAQINKPMLEAVKTSPTKKVPSRAIIEKILTDDISNNSAQDHQKKVRHRAEISSENPPPKVR